MPTFAWAAGETPQEGAGGSISSVEGGVDDQDDAAGDDVPKGDADDEEEEIVDESGNGEGEELGGSPSVDGEDIEGDEEGKSDEGIESDENASGSLTGSKAPIGSEAEKGSGLDSEESKDALETEKEERVASEDEAAGIALLNESKAVSVPQVATFATALKSSQVVDVPGASVSNSVGLQLYAGNTTPAQRFSLKSLGNGYYSIININSGKALDVRNASTRSGTVVQQYAANGTDAQAWSFVSTGDSDGSVYVVSKLKSTLVLDVRGGSAANGTALQVYSANKSKAQKFLLRGYSAAVKDGSYTVGSLATKTVLDVAAGSRANGANVQMYAKNGTVAQDFTFKYDASTGYYTIGSFASGKVLDVAGGAASAGTNVQQYSSNKTFAQKWTIRASSDGKGVVIISACGGLALDIAGASASNGANVQVYPLNGTKAQTWLLGTAPSSNLDGLYTIRASSNTKYAVDIASGSVWNGANAQLYAYNGSWAQKFQIQTRADGYCVIYSLKSGKVLDVANGGTKEGTNVQQYDYNGTDSQLWRAVKYGESTYGFQSKKNGLYLDIAGGSMSNGSNIQVWTGNGTAAQRFVLSKTDRSDSITEGAYIVKSVADGSVLDISGAGTANGARAQLYSNNGTFAQKFKMLSAGSGSYYFVNVHSSKYLDVDTGSKTLLQQWDRNTGQNQAWVFYPVEGSSGTYYIKSAYTGAYLTNSGGELRLASYTGASGQKFKLEHTSAFKVYLDAGHGYNSNGDGKVDVGAVAFGYRECDLTTDLVNRVRAQLDKLGIEYYVGYGKSYWSRHQDAVNMGCSTFLSIHFNAAGGRGTESYIHSYNAAKGSAVFQSVMHPYLVSGTGLPDRGRKDAEFAVCGGRLPSVLCEVAFIDNIADMNTYGSRKDTVARQLAQGLKTASNNSACGWY